MSHSSSRLSRPVALAAAAAVFAALASFDIGTAAQAPAGGAAAQDPAGPPPGARGQGRGGRQGGVGAAPAGRGANVLGEGPWDLDTEEAPIRVTVVTRDLQYPWGMAFIPDGSMLVTERPGRLRVIRNGVLDPTPIEGVPEVRAAVLGGLLDIALHPRFGENRLLYLSYSKPGDPDAAKASVAVARARWDGGPRLTDVTDIFVAQPFFGGQGTPRGCCGQGPPDGSYGSRLAFDRDGYLYVTIGDRNYGEMAQDPAMHWGKILRLRDDGSVPPDNPFVGREGYRPEIYSLGHRNPLGLHVHPVTGELWSTEFGPRGGDELNRVEAGKNYGWMLVTEGMHYTGEEAERGRNNVPGMEDPVLFWVPVINPGNLIFYNGDRFPAWKGDMLMGSMIRLVVRARFDAEGRPVHQERILDELRQRIRDVREGPDGLIYLLTDENAGAMLRIEPR
jgi:aldose sugar dehydrogenase